MYRKKNAAEKATDTENMAQAAVKEHQAVAEVIREAAEWGASGYARLGGLYFANLEDASGATCAACSQADETHVGDYVGMQGKWQHTTDVSVYKD